MKYLTKEQILKLQILEEYFNTAVNSGYKRNSLRQENELAYQILDEYQEKQSYHNLTCSVCIFNLFKKLGEIYYASKAYYASEAQERPLEQSGDAKVDNISPKPKKRTTAKKITTKKKTTKTK